VLNKISVVILTKNSSKYLKQVLNAVIAFDEIVILDNGSTDDTMSVAKTFDNVVVYEHEFIGFGPLKNYAACLLIL
jgi:glycosyltransferase involved in cell wall biosynthesis